MKNSVFIYPLLFLMFVSVISCERTLNSSLEYADGNRRELESVLSIYAKGKDPIKKNSAKFLIKNMPLHFTKTSKAVQAFTQRALRADTLTTAILAGWWKEYRNDNHIEIIYDSKSLSSEYLIDNIEYAVRTWRASKWRSEVSEELFYQYILPYRVMDEELSPIGWRDSLYQRYHMVVDTISDLKKAFHAIYRATSTDVRIRHLGDIPYLLNAIDVSHIKRGRCLQQCVYIVSVMRALGIPAVIDGVSRWANYSTTGHSWVALVAKDGTYTVYGDDKQPRRYNPINSSYFTIKYPVEKNYPVRLDFRKTVAKVWRSTYAFQETDYEDKWADKEVRNMFTLYHSVDVSGEYGLRGHYEVKVPLNVENAYLCTFRTGDDWMPICHAKRLFGKCWFGNLADSVVYLPMAYKGGKLMPLDAPFFMAKGRKKYIVPDTMKLQDITLTRKYPFARSILRPWQETTGASIVASDKWNSRDNDTLMTMTSTPVFRNMAYTKGKKSYRYVWYASSPRKRGGITEMRIYSAGKPIKGTSYSQGAEYVDRCFDDDTMTGLGKTAIGYIVGMDFGKSVSIDSVAVYQRNDGNYIDPDDEYELLHYRDGWHSIATQRAVLESLVFKNVLSGSLLLLKNHSKGKEERIFTYENGRQIWW